MKIRILCIILRFIGLESKYYYGTATDFKLRFNNHNSSFNSISESSQHATELSKYVHQQKRNATDYTLKWEIAAHAKPYSGNARKCDLCNTEKLFILLHQDSTTLLNKRNELLNKCRHQSEFVLRKYDAKKQKESRRTTLSTKPSQPAKASSRTSQSKIPAMEPRRSSRLSNKLQKVDHTTGLTESRDPPQPLPDPDSSPGDPDMISQLSDENNIFGLF